MPRHELLFEGFRQDEILNLPKETVERLILLGEPLVFRVGSAVLLGSFKIHSDRLVVELAQIEGGGDGVLVSLASLSRRYAKLHDLVGVEWIVHAVSCAKPNLKLRRVLEHRGFTVRHIEGVGKPTISSIFSRKAQVQMMHLGTPAHPNTYLNPGELPWRLFSSGASYSSFAGP